MFRCPKCGKSEDKVGRLGIPFFEEDGNTAKVVRWYECDECGHKFCTVQYYYTDDIEEIMKW
jgi:transcriptional regulator NrdR family protein